MKEQIKYQLKIAGVVLQFEKEEPLIMTEAFLPFITQEEQSDVKVYFQKVEVLPVISEEVIYETNFYRIHSDEEDGYVYSFYDEPRDLAPYAVVRRKGTRDEVFVEYLEKGTRCLSEMRNSFAHINFESILLEKKKMYFHAACVQTCLGGILFAGMSGSGKSTQAKLWEVYGGAKEINGDRPILSQEKDGWIAWGAPYAGSSKCYCNESCSIKGIVMLKKAEKCTLKRLSMLEAFKKVWKCLTVHSWDQDFMKKASELTVDLIQKVPVYEFECTPDETAVQFLKQELLKECGL